MIQKLHFALLLLLAPLFTLPSISAQDSITYLTNHPSNDRFGRYAPNGERIVFESDRNGNWDIFLLDKNTGVQTPLTKDTTDDRWPTWHPSGEKILFTSARSGKNRLYELDLDGSTVSKINLEPGLKEVNFAAWSPDGQTIAFSVQEAENQFNLYLFNLATQKSRALSSDTTRTLYPDWAPTGQDLVFFSRKETNNEDDEIYRMNVANSKTKRLTNWPKHNFCPSWSNNGKWIAYVTSMENIRPEIYIMNKNGKKQQRITHNETGDTLPDWSPDDRSLLITTYHNGNYELAEIKLPPL